MNLDEYAAYDATALARLVKDGQVSARELAQLAVTAIEKVNPKLNAVIEVWNDRVATLDEQALADGPFKGVPFLLKDLGPRIKGRRQDGGSRLTSGNVPQYSDVFSQRMMNAGLNIIGRTTCPEFGVTATTESALTGATCNPWDLSRIAGGSSGGSAAAVASGMVPMAHSNDGGGSIRIPAAVCGNIGMKHSRGLISYAPDGCDLSYSLFSEGVNARSVRDVAGFLDAVRGPEPGEPIAFIEPKRPYLDELDAEHRPLRIGLCLGPWGQYSCDRQVVKELSRIGRLCKDLGHEVSECNPSLDWELYFQTFRQIWCTDIAAMLLAESVSLGRPLDATTLEPITMKMYEEGRTASAAERLFVNAQINQIARQLGRVFMEFDVLLTPVLARETPALGSPIALSDPQMSLDEWFSNCMSLIPLTPLNNMTGTPAISLPMGRFDDGMPMGVQFMAPVGRDDLLINLAGKLEAAVPSMCRRPPCHIAA